MKNTKYTDYLELNYPSIYSKIREEKRMRQHVKYLDKKRGKKDVYRYYGPGKRPPYKLVKKLIDEISKADKLTRGQKKDLTSNMMKHMKYTNVTVINNEIISY